MNSLSRLLNELSVIASREYLSLRAKVTLAAEYYSLALRARFGLLGATVRFAGMRFQSPSMTNLVTILREVFVFGDYHFKTKTEHPFIVDCGANIGVSTLYFKKLYPTARILAIEPSKQNAETFRKNIELNNLTDVTFVEAAAGTENGTLSFYESPKRPGSSTMIREVRDSKEGSPKHSFREVTVPTFRLSERLQEEVDFLKMDIEGGETVVLDELITGNALQKIRTMVLEFHDNPLNPGNPLGPFVSKLAAHGFAVVVFNNEVGPSSENLKEQTARHFLIRADRVRQDA